MLKVTGYLQMVASVVGHYEGFFENIGNSRLDVDVRFGIGAAIVKYAEIGTPDL